MALLGEHYKLKCECGNPILTAGKEVQCPKCGRFIKIEWGADTPHGGPPEDTSITKKLLES